MLQIHMAYQFSTLGAAADAQRLVTWFSWFCTWAVVFSALRTREKSLPYILKQNIFISKSHYIYRINKRKRCLISGS